MGAARPLRDSTDLPRCRTSFPKLSLLKSSYVAQRLSSQVALLYSFENRIGFLLKPIHRIFTHVCYVKSLARNTSNVPFFSLSCTIMFQCSSFLCVFSNIRIFLNSELLRMIYLALVRLLCVVPTCAARGIGARAPTCHLHASSRNYRTVRSGTLRHPRNPSICVCVLFDLPCPQLFVFVTHLHLE